MDIGFIRHKAKSLLSRKSHTRRQLEDWLGKIDVRASRVLDVGAGVNPARYRVRRWEVGQVKTLDNNMEHDSRPDYLLDLNRLERDGDGWKHDGKKDRAVDRLIRFRPDVIFCLEVMEYVHRPEAALSFMHDILGAGGVLYISFHTIYPLHESVKDDSLRYTKSGIRHLLAAAGFSRVEYTAREATAGRRHLEEFFKAEKMFLAHTDAVFDLGYLVKAFK